jgi:hypothetical protein
MNNKMNNKMDKIKYAKAVLLLKSAIFLLFTAPVVNGIELSAILSSGVEYSNNVTQISTAARDDLTQTIGLSVVLNEERKRFNADASFNLEEEHYYNKSFSNQTSFTTGFGLFNFDIIENFLNWRTSFSRSEVLRNSTETDTPDNREQREITRTGPTVTYRINQKSTLLGSTTFVLAENGNESAADTKRLNSSVSYDYSFNNTTSFSLNSQYDDMLDGDGDDELTNTNVNVGILRLLSNGELKFNCGYMQTESEQFDTVSGNFFDLTFTQSQFFSHDWALEYTQDLSDTSIGLESEEIGLVGAPATATSAATATTGLDIIQSKRLNISMNREIGLYQYSLSGFWGYETYETQNNDEKSRGLSLYINHNVAQNLSIGFLYEFSLNDLTDRPEIGKEKTGTYHLNGLYSVSQDISVSTYLQYESRANSNNQSREYEEMTTGVSLTWELL